MAKRRISSPKQDQSAPEKQEELPDLSASDLSDTSLDGVSANYGNQAAAELMGLPQQDVQAFSSVDLGAPQAREAAPAQEAVKETGGGGGSGDDEGTEDLGGFQAKTKEAHEEEEEEPEDRPQEEAKEQGGEEPPEEPADEGGGDAADDSGGGGGGGGGGGDGADDGGDGGDGEGEQSGKDSPADGGIGGQDPDELYMRAKESTGNIMSDAVHDPMKKFLGHDFSHVRLHYDNRAGQLAKDLGTDAFAVGTHVYFAPGKYRPNSPMGNVLMAEQLSYVMLDDAMLARKSQTGKMDMGKLNQREMMDSRMVSLDAIRKGNKITQKGAKSEEKTVKAEYHPLRGIGGAEKDPPKDTPRAVDPGGMIFPSQAYNKPKLARSIDPTGGKRLKDTGMSMGGVGQQLEKMLGGGGGRLDASLEKMSTESIFKLGQQIFGAEVESMPREMLASQAVKIAQSANPGALPYKKELEAQFGVKLDNVKAFFGGKAADACSMVQARAFAVQNVVVFADASPSKDVVTHEITHVIQQGGHEKKMSGIPDKLPMSRPSDKDEHEAENVAADRSSGHSVKEGGSGAGVSRILDISMTQKEVMSAVVDNVIPDGFGANIGTFISEGDGIQGVIDGVKGTVNAASAFPVKEVGALFGGDAFSYLDPTAFMESIKPSGDTIVEQFATGVMGFCDATLGVLDGLLDTVTGILDLVETFVNLLSNTSKVLNIISKACYAIAVALAASVFGASLAPVFFNIARVTGNISNVLSNIANTVKGFLDPIKKVIDVLEKVREVVQKIRDIAEIVKMGCDVFDWLTADTADDRDRASQDLAGSIGSMSNVLGMFTGNIYAEFATSFWNNAQPIVVGQLQGANGAAQTNIPGTPQNTPLNNAFGSRPHAAIPGGITSDNTAGLVSNDQGNKPGEAVGAYRQIRAEEKKKNPPKEDEKEPPDLSGQVQRQAQSNVSPAPKAPGAPAPAAAAKGGNSGGLGSIVSGATGIVSNTLTLGLGGDVLQNLAVATGAKFLEQSGYPSSVDELFDYINNVMTEKETAESLDTQAVQRKQEAVSLEQNADEAIVAMQESKKVSEAQEASSSKNETAGHEGVGFMDYIMNLSANVQAKMEEKIDEAFGVNQDSNKGGMDALFNAKSAESNANSGQSQGFSALGIIKRVATAALKAVLGKILEKINIGKILQSIIPKDLGNIFELVTQFIQMAVAGKDQAKAKEEEARGAQSVLEGQIARDQAAQSESQANQALADQTIAEAQATKAAAQQSQAQADQQKQAARDLRASLDAEQARLEQGASTKMSEAGPLRPRNPIEQVEAPSGYEGLGTAPAAGDIGSMPGGLTQLPLSADQGNPHAVSGPVRSGSLGMVTQTPWADGSVTEADGATLTERADASRATDATNQPGSASDLFSRSGGDFQADAAFQGGPGGFSGPGMAGGDELVETRSFDAERDAVSQVVEARRPDPNVPPAVSEQIAEIQTPVAESMGDQENERFDALTERFNTIPDVEELYDTLEQLPEPAPDNTAYTQLRPISTGNLGYNSQHVIIDADVAQVSSWGAALPTDSHLTDAPAHGPIGEVPQFVVPTVSTVAPSQQTELPGLQLPDIAPAEVPFDPTTRTMRDNPRALGAASDVMDSVVTQAALADSLENANRIVDVHESEETALVESAHSGVMQIQLDHEMLANDAWLQRDQELRTTRRDWVSQQQSTVDTHQAQIGAAEGQLYGAAQESMQTGIGSADSTLRQGEQQAAEIELKADQDSAQLNSEAQSKAMSLWGWFRQHVAEFSANITDMMRGLWSQASSAIHSVLHGAETMAKGLISGARNSAANALASLSEQMSGLYGSMKSQLGSIGSAAADRIVAAVENAYAMVRQVADQAAAAAADLLERTEASILDLAGRTRAALEEEWAEFERAAQEVRDGRAQFPTSVKGADTLTDGETGEEAASVTPDLKVSTADGGDAADGASQGGGTLPYAVAPVTHGALPAGGSAVEVASGYVATRSSTQPDVWPSVGSQVTSVEKADDAAFRGSLEPLPALLAGESDLAQPGITVGGVNGGALGGPEGGAMPDLGIVARQQPDLSNFNPDRPLNLPDIDVDNPDMVPRANEVAGSINAIQVSNPGIDTYPGATPRIPLVGPSDPAHLEGSHNAGLEALVATEGQGQQAVLDSPGPEIVVPAVLNETVAVEPVTPMGELGPTEIVGGMQTFIDKQVDGEGKAAWDRLYDEEHRSVLEVLTEDVSAAIEERDTRRSGDITDAFEQANTHNADEQRFQLDEVAKRRQEIQEARDEALTDQDTQFRAVRDELGEAYRTTRGEVDRRVQTDQSRINDEFQRAERDAESTVAQGERDAEAEKRRAERDADSRSWWEKAGDWVKSQVDRVRNVVNGIFNRVRQAVTDIIEGVQALARDLIEQAWTFVTQKIQDFSNMVSEAWDGFVDFVGETLTALKELVDAAIELAKETIEATVERVRTFISDLADTVRQKLNDIALWFEETISAALQRAAWLLEDLWDAVWPDMLLETFFEFLMVGPSAFWGLMGKMGGLVGQSASGDTSVAAPSHPDMYQGADETGAPSVAFQGQAPSGQIQPDNASFDGTQGSSLANFSPREPDNMVDYYMEVHWDRDAEYEPKLSELRLHEQLGEAADKFGASHLSEDARKGAHLGYAITTGIIDTAFAAAVRAIPGVGSLFMIGDFISDTFSKHPEDYKDDGTGQALATVRSIADLVGSVVQNIGDIVTVVQDAALVTVVGAPIAGAIGWLNTIADSVGLVCDGIKTYTGLALTVHNIMMANEAERANDWRKAAKYRGLARSTAITTVVDAISFVISGVGLLSYGTVPTSAPEEIIEQVAKSGSVNVDLILEKMGKAATGIVTNKDGSLKVPDTLGKLGGKYLSGYVLPIGNTFNEVVSAVGLGDNMRGGPEGLEGGSFIDPGEMSFSGEAGSKMSDARSRSAEHFQTIWDTLAENRPAWNQKIINETINPPDKKPHEIWESLNKPSAWGEALIGLGVSAFSGIESGGRGAAAGILEGMAGGLDRVGAPIIEKINEITETWPEGIANMVTSASDALAGQREALANARAGLTSVDEFMEQVKGIGDQGGAIDTWFQGAEAKVDAAKATKESMGIPDWVPTFMFQWALDGYNGFLDIIRGNIQFVNNMVRPAIDDFVDQQMEKAQAHIDQIQEFIKEGGEVEAFLQNAVDTLTTKLNEFAASIASMDTYIDPHVIQSAIDWLKAEAAKQRAERLENRLEAFKEYLAGPAQGNVNGWRAANGPLIQESFAPYVPQWEVSALDEAYALIIAKLDEADQEAALYYPTSQRQRQDATRWYNQARSVARAPGAENIESFWKYADRVAEIAGAVGA